MRVVRLMNRVNQFNAGELVGFPDSIAEDLIARGAATWPEPPAEAAAVEAAQIEDLGRGWFLVAGTKVRGREAAEARLAELTG